MGEPDVSVELVLAGMRAMRSGASRGVLEGTRLGPRAVAKLAHEAGFRDDELFTAVAVCGAESWLFTRAHNDNLDGSGNVLSRDVGLFEINIPAAQIGTSAEESLYDPVTNAARAYSLWKSRGWQPWAAFNSGVYLHDTYTGWAMLGVANRLGEIAHAKAVATGYQTGLRVPFVSIKNARTLYPAIPWG